MVPIHPSPEGPLRLLPFHREPISGKPLIGWRTHISVLPFQVATESHSGIPVGANPRTDKVSNTSLSLGVC